MFPAYAQDSSNPIPLATGLFGNNPAIKYTQPGSDTIGAFISDILPNVFVLIGLILFIYLLFGGFLVITAAGNEHNLENGQKVITNAIIGFIIVFASYWLIQIIEIVTGVKIF